MYDELFMQNLEKHSEKNNEIPFILQWKYIGGDRGRHLRKYQTLFNKNPDIPHETRCICTHKIQENCYIENKISGKQLVLGNCCINRYLETTDQLCEHCKTPHPNRKDNYCSDCRGGILKFGKYKGKTFRYVLNHDINYCNWISKQESNNRKFIEFQYWLKNLEVDTYRRS
jgi:hypothetical protein